MGLGRNKVVRTGETSLHCAITEGTKKKLAVGPCTGDIQFLMRHGAKHFGDAIEQLGVVHSYG